MRVIYFLYIYILFKLTYYVINYNTIWEFNNQNLSYFHSLVFFFFFSGVILAIVLFFITSTRISKLFGLWISLSFPLVILTFFFFKNILLLLFMYECFILPSIGLVWFFSPNRRFLLATIYFIMWTQVGSFFILISFSYIYYYHNCLFINQLPAQINIYISMFLIFGFGVKIPTWPFHFWLTKTHVEAPTFFSIYLSGFLVKTALLGFIVLLPVLHNGAKLLLIFITFIGIIDATFKFMVQVDLKKLVAYATIQEMNLILLFLLFQNTLTLTYVGYFILTHTILSTLLFYFVDIIYKRYKARSITSVFGVYSANMFIGWTLSILIFLFLGFPGTIKFFLEINLFIWLIFFNKYIFTLLLFLLIWIGSVTFSRVWFLVLFGVNFFKSSIFFLKKDILILYSLYLLYFFLPYITYLS